MTNKVYKVKAEVDIESIESTPLSNGVVISAPSTADAFYYGLQLGQMIANSGFNIYTYSVRTTDRTLLADLTLHRIGHEEPRLAFVNGTADIRLPKFLDERQAPF